MATLNVTYNFDASALGFTGTPGAASTLTWSSTGGNTGGCLKSVITGRSKSNANSWALTTTFTALGIPSGSVITGITAGSLQSKCSAYTTGAASTSGSATLADGATTVTLSAARSFSAVDASWITTNGVDATGLSLHDSDSITITINNTLNTGASNTASVTLLQDNLVFTITYLTVVALTGQSSAQTLTVNLIIGKVGLQAKTESTSSASSSLYKFVVAPLSQLPAVIASIPTAALPTLAAAGGSAVALLASTTVKAYGKASGAFKAALTARGNEEAAARSQATSKAALSSRGEALSTAEASALGKLTLAAKGAAYSFARNATSGKLNLVGRAFGGVFGKSSPSGAVGLQGRSSTASSIHSTVTNTIQLLGRGFSRATLSATAKVSAALSLRSGAISASRQSVTGRVLLQSFGKAASSARGSIAFGAIQLIARGYSHVAASLSATSLAAALGIRSGSVSSAREQVSGKVSLAIRAASKAAASPQPSGKVALAAKAAADVFARATQSAKASLLASTAAVSTGANHATGRLALAARAFASTATRTFYSTAGQVVLFVASSIRSAARSSAPTGKVGLHATSAAVSKGTPALHGLLGIFARSSVVASAKSVARASLVMAARSAAATVAKGVLSLPGHVALIASGSAQVVARASYKVALSLKAASSASGKGAPSTSGKLGMVARSAASAAMRATATTQQFIYLLAQSVTKAASATSGKYTAVLSALGNSKGSAATNVTVLASLAAFGLSVSRAAYESISKLVVDPRFVTSERHRDSTSLAGIRQSYIALRLRSMISKLLPRLQFVAVRPRSTTSLLGSSMPQAPDYSPMDVGETVTGALDFGAWLAPGATITVVTSIVVEDFNPSTGGPFVTLNGFSQIGTIPVSQGGSGKTNNAVLQSWVGAAVGIARIKFTVSTSDGQTLIGWAHQTVSQPN